MTLICEERLHKAGFFWLIKIELPFLRVFLSLKNWILAWEASINHWFSVSFSIFPSHPTEIESFTSSDKLHFRPQSGTCTVALWQLWSRVYWNPQNIVGGCEKFIRNSVRNVGSTFDQSGCNEVCLCGSLLLQLLSHSFWYRSCFFVFSHVHSSYE